MIDAIRLLGERQFADALGTVVSTSKPVDKFIHLKGRSKQFEDVMQAIFAKGKHVFILGERGVGKTSLAKTVGIAGSNSNSQHFRQIGCSSDTTFDDLMRQIIGVFKPSRLNTIVKSSSFKFGSWLGFDVSLGKQESVTPPPKLTAPLAADILASLDDDQSNNLRVVVIDEVDRLVDPNVRLQLAELVKLLGDRGAQMTLIFTGVGTDLEQILGAHPSSFRQFKQIRLDRIDYQTSLDIIDDALGKFDLNWDIEPMRTARFRIASISNGFPYYVHLLVEKLLYILYADKSASNVTLEHLRSSIASAVDDAQMEIRKPYDKATTGRTDRYKHAAWAVADSLDLERKTGDIYKSDSGVCNVVDQKPITNAQFLQVLASLKRDAYGPLLKTGYRSGMYEYVENIVRGYLRLCASADGVELQDLQPISQQMTQIASREKRYQNPASRGSAPRGFERP